MGRLMERQAKDGTIYQQVGQDQWTPVTRTAKDGTVYKKIGQDSWTPMQQPEQDQGSMLEAGAIGLLQGATLNRSDEVLGALKGMYQDFKDYYIEGKKGPKPIRDEFGRITNTKDLDPGYFEKYRDEFKKSRQQLEQNYPVTSFVGELGGYLVPGTQIGKGVQAGRAALGLGEAATLGAKAGTLAAEGAVFGAATKPEGEDSVGQRFKQAVEGAAFGAAMPYAGAVVKAAGRGLKKIPKKMLSSMGSVSEENINKFLKDPERYLNAQTREEVVSKISGVLDDIDNRVVKGKDSVAKAKENLRILEREIKDGNLDKQLGLDEALSDAKFRLNERFTQVKDIMKSKPAPINLQTQISDSLENLRGKISEGSGKAYRILDEIDKSSGGGKLDIVDVISNIKNSADDFASEVGSADKAAARRLSQLYNDILERAPDGKITLKEVKRILQSLDNETTYSQNVGDFDSYVNSALKNVRRMFDRKLKTVSPDYANQMKYVQKDVDLLSRASKSFGTPDKAFSKLSNIAGKKGQLDRELLDEIGKKTGNDFVSSIDDFVKTQKTLKSPTAMEDIKRGLNEYSDVNRLTGQKAALRRSKKPAAIRERLSKSKQFQELKKSEFELKKAEKLKKKFVGWGSRTAEDKINAVMRNKKFVVNQLKELSKLSDDDLVRVVENLKVSEAFTKDATRGSRNVNLWSIIGLATSGTILGGPVGAALGAATGAMIDRYGPQMTKRILIAVSKMNKRPTVQRLVNLGLPKNVSEDLLKSLYRMGTAKAAESTPISNYMENEENY